MKYLNIKNSDGVLEVWLNRPELHNAFNAELIEEVIKAFSELPDGTRLVILSGEGSSFCAGADLNWMKAMKDYSQEENFQDSKRLAKMFQVINDCPVPVLGRINGHALGGGVGLVSVCDYALVSAKALLGFTEVRLGLIPAVISPFCIAKIGESEARAWMLSGERFGAQRAREMGLVHEVVDAEGLDDRMAELKRSFLTAGPEAARFAKRLIKGVLADPSGAEDFTCGMISERRISQEGQEGMKALLTKTKPNWVTK